MGAFVCIHKHVCGFVWVANINIIQYVIFQLARPTGEHAQNFLPGSVEEVSGFGLLAFISVGTVGCN